MTALPFFPDVSTAKDSNVAIKTEENWVHNWLYSVVPVSEQKIDSTINPYNGYGMYKTNYPLGAYLTGYCRNCRRAFSQPIPCDSSKYVETQMSIPIYGCVRPRE